MSDNNSTVIEVEQKEKIPVVKSIISFVIAAALAAVALWVQPPEGLSVLGWRALMVLLIGVVFWVSEVIPNMMTSFLVMLLAFAMSLEYVVSGAVVGGGAGETARVLTDIFTASGNNGLYFMASAFILAACVSATQVPKLLLRVLLKITKQSSKALIVGICIIGAIISMFVANGASTAMTVALATGILNVLEAKPGQSRLGRGMMIAAVFGSQCGGLAMPMSNIGNVAAITAFEKMGYEVSFGQWTIIGLPLAVISAILTGLIVAFWAKPEKITTEQYGLLQSESRGAKVTAKEIKLFIILAIMMYFWIFTKVNMALTGALGCVLMLLPGINITTWKDAQKQVLPDALFLICAVTVIVNAINKEGVGTWIVDLVFKNAAAWSIVVLVIMIMVITMIIHAIIPASVAVVGVVLVVMLPLAEKAGFSVIGTLVLISWFGSFIPWMPTDAVFMMAYGPGYWKFSDMMKVGVLVSIMMLITSGIWVPLICGITGI